MDGPVPSEIRHAVDVLAPRLDVQLVLGAGGGVLAVGEEVALGVGLRGEGAVGAVGRGAGGAVAGEEGGAGLVEEAVGGAVEGDAFGGWGVAGGGGGACWGCFVSLFGGFRTVD